MTVLLSALGLLAVVALTLGTAVAVATEFSLTALERSQVDGHAAAVGDRRARAVARAHRNLSFQLSGCQLAITLTTLVTGYIAEPAIASLIRPGLDGLGVPAGAAAGARHGLALVLATALSMVFGELVPKNLAIAEPAGTAAPSSGFRPASPAPCRLLIAVSTPRPTPSCAASASSPPRSCAPPARPSELGVARPRQRPPGHARPRHRRPHGPLPALQRPRRRGPHDARAPGSVTLPATTPITDLIAHARPHRLLPLPGPRRRPRRRRAASSTSSRPSPCPGAARADRPRLRELMRRPIAVPQSARRRPAADHAARLAGCSSRSSSTSTAASPASSPSRTSSRRSSATSATSTTARRRGVAPAAAAPGRLRACCAATRSSDARRLRRARGGDYETLAGLVRPARPHPARRGRRRGRGPATARLRTAARCDRIAARRRLRTEVDPTAHRGDDRRRPMNDLLALPSAVMLLVLNAFFVGAEFALISARRDARSSRAPRRARAARTALRAMENSRSCSPARSSASRSARCCWPLVEPAVAHLLERPGGDRPPRRRRHPSAS